MLPLPYPQQLALKQRQVERLLSPFGHVAPILGMESPYRYRNKVEAAFGTDAGGRTVCGKYQPYSHVIVPITDCLLEDAVADAIIADIYDMLREFRLTAYDERRERGMLRHVLVRRGFATDEIMVVLVLTVPAFRMQKAFAAALLRRHPDITTIVLNHNDRRTSMVLGTRETVLYGRGFIEDELCGCRFRISAGSFYQVNPLQTEKLYRTAIDFAALTGREHVLDAYCGTGTIGIAASAAAGSVLGVELNRDAVRDAIANARRNAARNCHFICDDAGRFLTRTAAEGRTPDVLFMDPPRSGSDAKFLAAVRRMHPRRIVYISCNPETLARDLRTLTSGGYHVQQIQPVDMFPHTDHVEVVIRMDMGGGRITSRVRTNR